MTSREEWLKTLQLLHGGLIWVYKEENQIHLLQKEDYSVENSRLVVHNYHFEATTLNFVRTWPLFGFVTHMWPIQTKKVTCNTYLDEKLGGFRCVSPIVYLSIIQCPSSLYMTCIPSKYQTLTILMHLSKIWISIFKSVNALPSSKLETR
jgi:hypothetical protein